LAALKFTAINNKSAHTKNGEISMLPREHYLKQAFLDSAHFPNGFEKGGLSDIQARLVRKNGTLISALCIDEVSDPTSEDLHILKVIANQSSPKNPVEQAWVKYLSLVKSLSASAPKTKSKAKAAAKPAIEEPAPEPAKPATKAEKSVKTPAKAPAKAPSKKAETAPAEAKTKPAAKKADAAPVKAPAKPVAKKAEPATAKAKATAKKPEPKADTKKPAAKKSTKTK
jgi:uncharacterized protein